MREHYGLRESVSEIQREISGMIEDFYRNEAALKPGVREFLRGLAEKNIPMVIATAGDRELLNAALARNGIAEYFCGVFTCSELGTDKHTPKIFLACAESLGLAPGEVAVFEDSSFALRAAEGAGFITFMIEEGQNCGYTFEELINS